VRAILANIFENSTVDSREGVVPPVRNFSESPTRPPCNDITTSKTVIKRGEVLAQKRERKSPIRRNRRRRRYIDTQIKAIKSCGQDRSDTGQKQRWAFVNT